VIEDRRSPDEAVRLRATREFFADRAAGWDTKFGSDSPAYSAAVSQAGFPPGTVVADIGCGTGRALPALRESVGPGGGVLGIDVTPEMLDAVRTAGRAASARLLLADALRLPIRDSALGGVFAAGLVNHLPDVVDGLRELARVTAPAGRLALFHPTGRRALAARHGREVSDDEPLSPRPLRAALTSAGWELLEYDDSADRFLALAQRVSK
jgi:SAM-dependent methyltransferase